MSTTRCGRHVRADGYALTCAVLSADGERPPVISIRVYRPDGSVGSSIHVGPEEVFALEEALRVLAAQQARGRAA